ncbi:UvrD-helicase domain-containing protein, partial [Streptococcus suis]
LSPAPDSGLMPPWLERLNPPQREAVLTTDGPVLMLAGAGTGKTAALTARMAWLLQRRLAWPSEILCVTFTNKAAGEMRERVHNLIGQRADGMWISTFHSACVRILRREAQQFG